MPLTLDEITEHEKRARREIAERECLLAVLKVLRGYTLPGDTSTPTGTDLLHAGFLPSTPQIEWKELSALSSSAPPTPSAEQPIPPAPAPIPSYVHPELKGLGNVYGSGATVVKWAIKRMTGDYTVRDLLALLEREGEGMDRAHASLVSPT